MSRCSSWRGWKASERSNNDVAGVGFLQHVPLQQVVDLKSWKSTNVHWPEGYR